MRPVLDADALLAYLLGEPAAGAVADVLREGALASAVTRGEIVDRLVRLRRADPVRVDGDLHLLDITWLEHDVPLAARAGRLRARHYRRGGCDVSMADCAAAALALSRGAPLMTGDAALASVLVAEGGVVIPLAPPRAG